MLVRCARVQHGDKTNYRFVNGVQRKRHKQLTKMASRSAMAPFNTIYVCQSNPDLWDPKPKALLGNVRAVPALAWYAWVPREA